VKILINPRRKGSIPADLSFPVLQALCIWSSMCSKGLCISISVLLLWSDPNYCLGKEKQNGGNTS